MPTHPAPPAGELQSQSAPPDGAALHRALLQRLRLQTKPPGSLGLLEETAVRLGRLQRTTRPQAEVFRLCVFAGSHGIAELGVSAYPPEVTAQMVGNFLGGGAAVCVLARATGASLHIIDMGVDYRNAAPPDPPARLDSPVAPCFSTAPSATAPAVSVGNLR